ncbi:MAG TPA: hypothetical protein VF096_04200 [Azonexus sp.]
MHSQRKPAAPRKTRASAIPSPRPEYTAAVRFRDGRRDIFRVRNADDMADARAMVLAELDDVANLVLALRN